MLGFVPSQEGIHSQSKCSQGIDSDHPRKLGFFPMMLRTAGKLGGSLSRCKTVAPF